MIFPSAIIFINSEANSSILSTLSQQLYIDEVLDGYVFDGYVASYPGYISSIYRFNQRIVVVRNFKDPTNRSLADLVLYFHNGMLSFETNRFGPPGLQIKLANIQWGNFCLFATPTPKPCFNTLGNKCCGSCTAVSSTGCNTCGNNANCNGCGRCYCGCSCTITCGCAKGCTNCAFTAKRPYAKPDHTQCPQWPDKGPQELNLDVEQYEKYNQ